MQAVEFIKKFGWSEAKKIINPNGVYLDLAFLAVDVWGLDINDLKQYVDAWELVQSYGGLQSAFTYLTHRAVFGLYQLPDLRKAISLVEQVNEVNKRD